MCSKTTIIIKKVSNDGISFSQEICYDNTGSCMYNTVELKIDDSEIVMSLADFNYLVECANNLFDWINK